MVVLFAVPEEVATSAEGVNSQKRLAIVLPLEDVIVSDHSSGSSQAISESGVMTGKSLLDVKRHSTMRCSQSSSITSSDSAFSSNSTQNIAHEGVTSSTLYSAELAISSRSAVAHEGADKLALNSNSAALTTDRKLPRRATTRRQKLSRKSTRRVWRQRVPDTEFDDDDVIDVDDGEDVEFSETDSEPNDDERPCGSEESDLEFETELARQLNASQVYFSDCLYSSL